MFVVACWEFLVNRKGHNTCTYTNCVFLYILHVFKGTSLSEAMHMCKQNSEVIYIWQTCKMQDGVTHDQLSGRGSCYFLNEQQNCSRATHVAIIRNGNAGRFDPKVLSTAEYKVRSN